MTYFIDPFWEIVVWADVVDDNTLWGFSCLVLYKVMSMARSYSAVRGPAPSKRGNIPECSLW